MGELFTPNEAKVFARKERLKPSEWAEQYRYLPSSVAAEPGKFRNSRTPYMAGIIDTLCEDGVEEICFLKPVQAGFTTNTQNIIGYCIDVDPAPMLIVMPSEKEAGNLVEENLRPLIDSTPQLQTHLTGDADAITKASLTFDSMPIYLGWAGAPASLQRRACKYIILDEVDKFPAFSGREADPIALARARATTFGHRKKIIIGSTPTTTEGHIYKAYQSCGDKRSYWISCPHCSAYQVLAFPQIKFNVPESIVDSIAKAEYIDANRCATYECKHCLGVIRDLHKQKMLLQGRWLSEGQTITKDGQIIGEKPKAKKVGFHLNSLYSPWVSFSQIAAQFLRSKDDVGLLMEFVNHWLAEPFANEVTKLDTKDIKVIEKDAGIVPKWAGVLVASADTQDDGFYYVIRAWGRNKSQLVAHGEASTLDELKNICLFTPYQIDGVQQTISPRVLLIDTGGHRTSEIYQFSLTDPRIVAIKGNSNPQNKQTISRSMVAKEMNVYLHSLDTGYFKDQLVGLKNAGKWLINQTASSDEIYLRHMASEHKTIEKGKAVWTTIAKGGANHYWDCEVYNVAGAQIVQSGYLPDEAIIEAERDAEEKAKQQPPQPQQLPAYNTNSWSSGGSNKGGWLGKGSGQKAWV